LEIYLVLIPIFAFGSKQMISTAHISKFLGVITLIFVLMLPTTVQFSHLFEKHDHEICFEQNTHIHQDEPDCHVCDFYGTSIQYTLPGELSFIIAIIPAIQKAFFLGNNFSTQKLNSKQLRAPPVFLS
jgi:hypothetical protein